MNCLYLPEDWVCHDVGSYHAVSMMSPLAFKLSALYTQVVNLSRFFLMIKNIQSTLFIPTLDTTTKFVIMTIRMS